MTVTVTPTVEADNTPPRIRLNITASAGEASTTVTRLDPDGRLVPVRTSDGGPVPISGGAALLYDYEAPFDASVIFSTMESPNTASAAVTLPASRVWLIHPGVPELSTPIEARAGSFEEESWDVQQGVHWPMGRMSPVIQTEGQRRAPASSFTVAIESTGELDDLRALVNDTGVLLLNVPATSGLGIDTCYIAVGAIKNRRISDIGTIAHRAVEMPYQVVDRPVGGTQAERTWADVVAENATWGAVKTRYATWFDLLAGP